MKRTIVLCFVLVLASASLVLAGGEGEKAAAEGGAGGADVTNLVVAINNAPWLPGYEGIAKAYEEATGVKIDLRVFPMTQLTERTRNAAEAQSSEFDIITMNAVGNAQFYDAGLVQPFADIDPSFELDPAIIEYFNTTRWDPEEHFTTDDGVLMGLPINGNIQVLYYRKDLYDQAGLDAPETWQDVIEASNMLADPDNGFYGYVVRGKKGTLSISWNFNAFLRGFGGSIFRDPPEDWTVVINNNKGVAALELFLELAHEHSPPNVANIGQSEIIAMLQSDRVLQAIAVNGAFLHMDDPERSSVVDKIDYAVVPKPVNGRHATTTGELVQAIPRNLPEERQQAALEFLKYVTSFDGQVSFAEHGGVPIRSDVYTDSKLAGQQKYRYFEATVDSEPYLTATPRIPETLRVTAVLEQRLNEAVSGELGAQEALDLAAEEIHEIINGAGYETGMIE